MKRVIKEGGFTVTEMIVTIALIGLLIVPVVETSLHFYADATSSNRKATLSLESQATIGKFTEDLRMASGVNASNLISDPNQGGGWATNSANHILVMAMPAQDSDGNFIIDPATGKLYNNEVVYYSSGTTLYRRSLPNTAASGNAMIQSCPPISATLDCPADVVMTKYFSTSTFTFYDSDGIQTADPNAAHSVEIHLETTDSAKVDATKITNTVRVAMRNI